MRTSTGCGGRSSRRCPRTIVPAARARQRERPRLTALGMERMRRGEMAVVVLAGGMATRMGGVVKALVEAVPGVTFLDARLAERDHWSRLAGAEVPLWLMTSHATDAANPRRARRPGRRRVVGRLPTARLRSGDAAWAVVPGYAGAAQPPRHRSRRPARRGAFQCGLLGQLRRSGAAAALDRQPRQPRSRRRSAGAGVAPRPNRAADGRGGGQGGRRSRRHPGAARGPAGDPGGLPAARGVRRGRGAGVQHQHVPGRRARS